MEATESKKAGLPVGVGVALMAAALFGLSTPFAKLLLGNVSPMLLAGLLYLGSGVGLTALYFSHQTPEEAGLKRADLPWLAGAVVFGGMVAPVLLLFGLRLTPASSASLLLNLEGVFTALLAWFAFHENFDKRIAFGMGLIVAGGVVLSWHGSGGLTLPLGSLLIVGACLCWGIDNNLTQKVSASNPYQIAAIKGMVAGSINLGLAFLLGAKLLVLPLVGGGLLVGFVGYGLSLACFVLALRNIGTARTGAYFSLAPFVGAAVSLLLLHEPVGPLFLVAALCMAAGVWLHLTEKHEHKHSHERMTHRHSNDEHHQHEHAPGVDPTEPHTHEHEHAPLMHSHPHYPDLHHRHGHSA